MRKLTKTLILFIFLICSNSFANDRIAVAGHSLAANFAWFNQIDIAEDSCAWITNHAVGGDNIWSNGLYGDEYMWVSPAEPNRFYPKGYGKGRITSIMEESANYDYLIYMNGDNDYNGTPEGLALYLKKLDSYLYNVRLHNPYISIIAFLMVDRNNKDKTAWNKEIRKIYEKHGCYVERWPEYMVFSDASHFDKASNQKLWEELKLLYHIEE